VDGASSRHGDVGRKYSIVRVDLMVYRDAYGMVFQSQGPVFILTTVTGCFSGTASTFNITQVLQTHHRYGAKRRKK
jgi:hypothetical protein